MLIIFIIWFPMNGKCLLSYQSSVIVYLAANQLREEARSHQNSLPDIGSKYTYVSGIYLMYTCSVKTLGIPVLMGTFGFLKHVMELYSVAKCLFKPKLMV